MNKFFDDHFEISFLINNEQKYNQLFFNEYAFSRFFQRNVFFHSANQRFENFKTHSKRVKYTRIVLHEFLYVFDVVFWIWIQKLTKYNETNDDSKHRDDDRKKNESQQLTTTNQSTSFCDCNINHCKQFWNDFDVCERQKSSKFQKRKCIFFLIWKFQ